MSTGLIQLVSRGNEDNYLIGNPQFTLFKFVYKRHTNFSIQQIPIKFLSTPDFNNKVSLSIDRFGDMIHRMNLYITLPELPQQYNTDGSINEIIKYAWSKNIAHVFHLFLWPHLQHMFSGPGLNWSYICQSQRQPQQISAASCITACSNAISLTY